MMIKINLRAISCLMAVMLVMASVMIVPVEVSADSIIAGGRCGDNLTWTLDNNGAFTVSGTGDMWDYEECDETPWWKCRDKTIAVYINDGVTSVGESAFLYFENLESITLPDSLTRIGDYAFEHCIALTGVTFPDGLTSIGGTAFKGCRALDSFTIPDGVTSIGGSAFYDTAYYNNDENWENDVLYLGNRLIDAKTSIAGSYSIRPGTTAIEDHAFGSCTALTSIMIPNSVTRIGQQAFEYCIALTSVTIPDGVFSIGAGAFIWCTALESVTIPNSVTYFGGSMFSSCRALTDITLPDSMTYIVGGMFSSCESLMSITLPDSVTSIGRSAFYGCTALESITLSDSVTSIEDGAFYFCSALDNITIPDSVTSIEGSAFLGCSALKSITIPDSVTSIGEGAFGDCSALENIQVDENNSDYISVDGVLYSKDKTRLICYPAGRKEAQISDSVTSIGAGAFEFCESLTSITLPDSVTSIGRCAFYGCTALESITIPNGVTSIEEMTFSSCIALKSITIPKRVTSIMEWAFEHCRSLESITLPDGVTSIGKEAFECCESLTSITIPNSVTSIVWNSFDSCDKLTIYGESGSYAQEYAKEESIPFRSGVFVGDRFFLDVKPGAWYLGAVEYALDNGLFFGVSPKMFAPDESMTRAMLVTVLWRMEGEPAESGENPFNDVPSGEWYTDAVKWASANGIVYGISEDKYDPTANVTREQAAAILYRYSQYKEYDVSKTADLAAFPDGDQTSDYAVTELSWAYGEGLITGVKKGSTDYLEPQGNATRAQVASMLLRYKESFAK